MASDQPSAPPDQTEQFLKTSAIAGAIICPLVMLMPPRKVDARFFVLATGFGMSTSHLAKVYTGESLFGRFNRRANDLANSASGLPAEAQKTQALLREHKMQMAQEQARLKGEQQQRQEDATGEKSKVGLAKVVDEVWMGGEDQDWQKKRLEEHQRTFDQGGGMLEIITDQIADVWNGNWRPGSKKSEDEDDESKPEEKK